eukprot:447437_1
MSQKETYIDTSSEFYKWIVKQKAATTELVNKLIYNGYDTVGRLAAIDFDDDFKEVVQSLHLMFTDKLRLKTIIETAKKETTNCEPPILKQNNFSRYYRLCSMGMPFDLASFAANKFNDDTKAINWIESNFLENTSTLHNLEFTVCGWIHNNIQISLPVASEIIDIIIQFSNSQIAFYTEKHGQCLEFTNDDKTVTMTGSTHGQNGGSTCLLSEPIQYHHDKKVVIKIKVKKLDQCMVFGYVSCRNDIKNWNAALYASISSSYSTGVAISGIGIHKNDIISISFNFKTKKWKITLNNYLNDNTVLVERDLNNGTGNIFPGFSFIQKHDSLELLKYQYS